MSTSCFSFLLLLTLNSPSLSDPSEPCLPSLSQTRLFSSPPAPTSLGRKVEGLRPKGLRGRSLSPGFLTQAIRLPVAAQSGRPGLCPGGWPGLTLSVEGQDWSCSPLMGPGCHPWAIHPAWKTTVTTSPAKATTTHTKWESSLHLQIVVGRHGKGDIFSCDIRIR